MRKLFPLFLAIVFCLFSNPSFAIYGQYDEFNDTDEVESELPPIIPKGSFFRGFMGQTVSSEFNNDNDIVKILIVSDFILNDKVILPKNSVFVGHVKSLEKAQQGRNGLFSIDIDYLIIPDGRQYESKGYLVAKKGARVFGGEFSRRSGHKTTLHRSACFGNKGTLQLQQNGPRIMGKETKINMGEFVTILLEEAIQID